MYKKRLIIAVVMAVCFMTACTRKTDSEGGVVGALLKIMGIRRAGRMKMKQGACQMMSRLLRMMSMIQAAVLLKRIPQNLPVILSTGRFQKSFLPVQTQKLNRRFRLQVGDRFLSVRMSTWRE